MLSDEEKKAIHDLKILRQGIELLNCIPNIEKDEVDIKAIDIVLNLIEKQFKEIEELKLKNEKLYEDNLTIVQEIEVLKKKPIFLIKDLYNRKLKEISLQDAEGLIEQGREEMVDKIKAKIEELEKQDRENRMSHNYLVIPVLQSLLEKE